MNESISRLAQEGLAPELSDSQLRDENDQLHRVNAVMLEALKEVMRVLESPKSTVAMPHTARKVKRAINLAEGKQ